MNDPTHSHSYDAALDSARRKAYMHLIPLLFVCYVVAYIDRVNVGFAKLRMAGDPRLTGFDEGVFGFGMGIFFFGYLLLEIPGTLIVEKWSARKWICRIMITWGVIAALTALVRKPWEFYALRFLLGLGEAGFYPGVIVYLTHWFPKSDRTRALAWFFIGTPIAQIMAPPISERLMRIGVKGDPPLPETYMRYFGLEGNPPILGMDSWQWVFVFWGLPAVLLGLVVYFKLCDRPRDAGWLTLEEREALELALERERREQLGAHGHMTVGQALSNPRVLALAAAYFFVVTGNYGIELYMASILENWYQIDVKKVAYLIIIPPIGSLIGQIFVGINSDRTGERTFHAVIPIVLGAAALFLMPASKGNMVLTVALFTVAMTGLKAYLPAFWALPNQFLTAAAAAASIGMINSFGNLGGWIGPWVIGFVKKTTGNFNYGLWYLGISMIVSAVIIYRIGNAAGPKSAGQGGSREV